MNTIPASILPIYKTLSENAENAFQNFFNKRCEILNKLIAFLNVRVYNYDEIKYMSPIDTKANDFSEVIYPDDTTLYTFTLSLSSLDEKFLLNHYAFFRIGYNPKYDKSFSTLEYSQDFRDRSYYSFSQRDTNVFKNIGILHDVNDELHELFKSLIDDDFKASAEKHISTKLELENLQTVFDEAYEKHSEAFLTNIFLSELKSGTIALTNLELSDDSENKYFEEKFKRNFKSNFIFESYKNFNFVTFNFFKAIYANTQYLTKPCVRIVRKK